MAKSNTSQPADKSVEQIYISNSPTVVKQPHSELSMSLKSSYSVFLSNSC